MRGVRLGHLPAFQDARGSFREVWRAAWFPDLGSAEAGSDRATFVQANVSRSEAGVLRGLHLHRKQLDHWVVLDGRAFVALVDVRPMLAGAEDPVVETRLLAQDDWVSIPVGVAHGFLALEPLELLYLVTNEYDGSDELGFAWDDATAGVAWPPVDSTPDRRPIVSERDRSNPTLRELVERLRI